MIVAERAAALGVMVAVLVAVSGPDARAQTTEAEVLFREGRKLIKQGDVAGGCAKLAASERLETSVGTLLNLGDCRQTLGQLAGAWTAFRKAEAMARSAGDDKRMAEARRRAGAIEPDLSNLVIQVNRPVAGMVISRDGEVVDAAVWNTAIPIDPGTYAIVAQAPGRVPWRTAVPIDPKSRRQVVQIPELRPAEPGSTEPTGMVDPAVTGTTTVPTVGAPAMIVTTRRRGTWTTPRKLSVAFAIAGVGAAGAGLYFGLHARDLQDQSDGLCPTAVCDDPIGLQLNDDAQTAATRANIFYIAGGAAVATAAVLWLVGRPGEETLITPAVGNGSAGVSFAGRF